jgi:hypothetical protein
MTGLVAAAAITGLSPPLLGKGVVLRCLSMIQPTRTPTDTTHRTPTNVLLGGRDFPPHRAAGGPRRHGKAGRGAGVATPAHLPGTDHPERLELTDRERSGLTQLAGRWAGADSTQGESQAPAPKSRWGKHLQLQLTAQRVFPGGTGLEQARHTRRTLSKIIRSVLHRSSNDDHQQPMMTDLRLISSSLLG